jgi:hypothetical protein
MTLEDLAALSRRDRVRVAVVETHAEAPRLARWQQDLDRIELAVANIRTPPSYASEVYQPRTHVALVRRTLDARTAAS